MRGTRGLACRAAGRGAKGGGHLGELHGKFSRRRDDHRLHPRQSSLLLVQPPHRLPPCATLSSPPPPPAPPRRHCRICVHRLATAILQREDNFVGGAGTDLLQHSEEGDEESQRLARPGVRLPRGEESCTVGGGRCGPPCSDDVSTRCELAREGLWAGRGVLAWTSASRSSRITAEIASACPQDLKRYLVKDVGDGQVRGGSYLHCGRNGKPGRRKPVQQPVGDGVPEPLPEGVGFALVLQLALDILFRQRSYLRWWNFLPGWSS